MNEKKNITLAFFKTNYDSLLVKLQEDHHVLVHYMGELNQEIIAKLEAEIETKIIENNIQKGSLKKIFFISVETLQNMFIHGNKSVNSGHENFFILAKNTSKVNIVSANLIANSAIPALQQQLNTINSFTDPSALKQYYMQHLENNELSEKGGAGLGFITIAMKSGNPLVSSFQKIDDDFSLILLTSTVNIE